MHSWFISFNPYHSLREKVQQFIIPMLNLNSKASLLLRGGAKTWTQESDLDVPLASGHSSKDIPGMSELPRMCQWPALDDVAELKAAGNLCLQSWLWYVSLEMVWNTRNQTSLASVSWENNHCTMAANGHYRSQIYAGWMQSRVCGQRVMSLDDIFWKRAKYVVI